MACRRATVTGVPALLLRIGFVGETGWEIHVPAECGEQVWDAIMTAGAEFRIVPFGVGAQRILRLEKKHVIVGQDTDALSNPLEADMEWVVKFNKDDFIGKRGLQAVQERGPRHKLVGFALRDFGMAEGGQAVVVNGQPAGRVASAAFSPTAGKCVGLAWVPVEVAGGTGPFQIRINGTDAQADVIDDAFYDPQGERLRS
jgi:sarcosine oxidase subunit alpha